MADVQVLGFGVCVRFDGGAFAALIWRLRVSGPRVLVGLPNVEGKSAGASQLKFIRNISLLNVLGLGGVGGPNYSIGERTNAGNSGWRGGGGGPPPPGSRGSTRASRGVIVCIVCSTCYDIPYMI